MGLFQSNELTNLPELPIELYAKILYHTNNMQLLKYVSKEIAKINVEYISHINTKEILEYYEKINMNNVKLSDRRIFVFNVNKIFTVSEYYTGDFDGVKNVRIHTKSYPYFGHYNQNDFPNDYLFTDDNLRNYDLRTMYNILTSKQYVYAKKTCIDTLNDYCNTMPLLHSWIYMAYNHLILKKSDLVIEGKQIVIFHMSKKDVILEEWHILKSTLMDILQNLSEDKCTRDIKYIMKFVKF